MVRSSEVTTKRPAASASSSLDMPPLRRPAVALGEEVDPRGGDLEAVVDGRAKVVDLVRPRWVRCAFHGLDPDAAHLGLDLAVAVGADAAAGAVAEGVGAGHGAGHAG